MERGRATRGSWFVVGADGLDPAYTAILTRYLSISYIANLLGCIIQDIIKIFRYGARSLQIKDD